MGSGFKNILRSLFRQIGDLAMRMGLIRLGEVGLDGTRAKANNSRGRTLTAATLKERLASLEGQIERMFREAEEADRKDQQLFDTGESSRKLPPELADAKKRQQQLKQALEAVEAADESRRRKKGIDAQENPAQVPTVSRDEYEEDRERLAAKMSSDEAQAVYRRRLHIAETPFAVIKCIMNLRQFLLRGLENVKTEWSWACTAFNLKKLAREIARLRAHFRNLQETVAV